MLHSYPVRVAVIGLGKMGTRHLRVLQKMPHLAELCAVFDIDKRKVIQAENNILQKIGVNNYKDLFNRCPEAIIVATPIGDHATPTIEALGKEISVLVEKPIADNIRDAEIMIDMACGGTILMVGYTERFNGAVQILKEEIEGEPLIAIVTRRAGPYPTPQTRLSIIDTLATHDIDLIHYLTGADFESIAPETNGTDFFSATFKLTNGIMGSIEADKLSPLKQRLITIWGKGKFWQADLITQEVRGSALCEKSGVYTTQVSRKGYTEPLREELKAFLRSVATGAMPPITGGDGLKAIEVAQRCQ